MTNENLPDGWKTKTLEDICVPHSMAGQPAAQLMEICVC